MTDITSTKKLPRKSAAAQRGLRYAVYAEPPRAIVTMFAVQTSGMHCACVHTKCRHALRMRSHELESDARFCCKSPPPPPLLPNTHTLSLSLSLYLSFFPCLVCSLSFSFLELPLFDTPYICVLLFGFKTSGKNRRLTIHRTFSENGRLFVRTEIVKRPAVIDAYLKIKHEKDGEWWGGGARTVWIEKNDG